MKKPSLTSFPTEHGRSFRLTLPTSHPLSDTGPCTGRPERLMSASLKFIAPGITADATAQPEFDRYLAALAAEACDAMQWWAQPTTRPIEILHVSRSSICLFRPSPRKHSTDGNGDRFLTGDNDSMIGHEKIRVNILTFWCIMMNPFSSLVIIRVRLRNSFRSFRYRVTRE